MCVGVYKCVGCAWVYDPYRGCVCVVCLEDLNVEGVCGVCGVYGCV